MNNFIKDLIINYLLKNQAPKRISYTGGKETKVFGFWVYLGNRDDAYVIQKRTGKLKYECIKIDAPEEEAGNIYTKYIGINNGYSFTEDVFIRFYYNGFEIRDLKPIKAFFIGTTFFYKILGWLENKKYRKSLKNNEKAYSLYCDRLRLLELVIDIRNKQHEENVIFSNSITNDKLIKSIARASVVTSKGYYTYIEPILKGLQEETALSIDGDNKITILPKAWHLVSDYYVDERRHSDNQKSLKWQRYLTALLAIGSIGNIFKDEIRSLFGL